MKQWLLLMLLLFCLFGTSTVWAAEPPEVAAEAAIVMVADSRQVLFEKNADNIMYPASTTKIMTLITALEAGKLDRVVKVSARAAATEGSSLDLQAGDRLVLQEALYGMMMVSGNDAAEAIAETVGGSRQAFVAMMNAKAEKLGATRTHFSNPHGLPDPINHFSTARDLALMSAYGLKNPMFAKIVANRSYDVHFLNRPTLRVTNTNKLLGHYAGADGIKTGYTEAAGDCLVASATRGNVQLIAVVLNDDDRWDDVPRLLDYGFRKLGLQE